MYNYWQGCAQRNYIWSLYFSILMRNAACSNSNVTFLHLLFIFSLGKTERPFNQKKKKKATFHQTSCINYEYAFRARPSRCLVAIGKPFCFLFLNSGCGIPKWTQEAISTAQLASQAIIVEKKPMVIFSAGYLDLGLKHTVQWNTCNKRANMQPKNTEI